MDISIQVTDEADGTKVKYIGPINEEAEVHLLQLAGRLGKHCVINFRQVELVNSCGVRCWINFMRDAEREAGREIIFEECTSEIVMQINMIPSFRGSALVKSVYASFVCDNCNSQEMVLFEQGKNMPQGNASAEAQVCKSCGSAMEMEELEDEFFAFNAT
jgi:anti-anti-sigma regulatory factor